MERVVVELEGLEWGCREEVKRRGVQEDGDENDQGKTRTYPRYANYNGCRTMMRLRPSGMSNLFLPSLLFCQYETRGPRWSPHNEERNFVEAYGQRNPARRQEASLAFIILYTTLQARLCNTDASFLDMTELRPTRRTLIR